MQSLSPLNFFCKVTAKSEGVANSDLDFHFFSKDLCHLWLTLSSFSIGWDQFHT